MKTNTINTAAASASTNPDTKKTGRRMNPVASFLIGGLVGATAAPVGRGIERLARGDKSRAAAAERALARAEKLGSKLKNEEQIERYLEAKKNFAQPFTDEAEDRAADAEFALYNEKAAHQATRTALSADLGKQIAEGVGNAVARSNAEGQGQFVSAIVELRDAVAALQPAAPAPVETVE